MQERQEAQSSERSQGENIFDYLLPVKTIIFGTEARKKYIDFCELPLEKRRKAFEQMSPQKQLEASIYSAQNEIASFAIALPFLRGLPKEQFRIDLMSIEKIAETLSVLQTVLQKGVNDDNNRIK